MAKPDPVVVIGAGPVGLCLALALAQQEVAVVLVEALSDDNFLDQVPRAGSNHPTTLEFFDRIGLYAKMEPRGLIAPKFQYWDRQDNALIAEFDHALLKKEGDEKLGLYHFGMWVDDLDEAEKKVVDAGGKYLAGRPTSPNSFYEAKYKSPTGLVFDLTHRGWAGAVKDVVPAKEPASAK